MGLKGSPVNKLYADYSDCYLISNLAAQKSFFLPFLSSTVFYIRAS